VTGYTAPSTGQTVRAVLFDTFGTVVDWRAGISSAVRAFAANRGLRLDPEGFADAWRAQYQPSMERVRSGHRPYVSLDTLHRENLDTVLRSHDIDPGAVAPGELAALVAAWHYLPPWPDSAEGIRRIKRDFIVGPLSNGTTALLVDMAKAAGLDWDVILGSDISRSYKPSPDAYRIPAALLGLDPGEVMLVAAHNGDLEAARRTGLATAFIARPAEHGPGQATDLTASDDWDLTATSVTDLARQLLDDRPRARGRQLLPDTAVDPFPEQVGVAAVAGVLLDHVHQHLTQRDGVAVAHGAADTQVGRIGDELVREGDLLAPGLPGTGHDGRVGDRAEPVSVGGLVGPEQRGSVGLGHHPPEPVALHIGHVTDETEQRHGGGRYRPAGELVRVEALALHFHRYPVGMQVVEQRRPLAVQIRARRESRILCGVHPHVGGGRCRAPPGRLGIARMVLAHDGNPVMPAPDRPTI
jgi:2-haloacid dehalogenase